MIISKLIYFKKLLPFILCGFFFAKSNYSQNVISVRKEEKKELVSYKGVYYSDRFSISSGAPGRPPTDFIRMYIYIDDYNRIYIFHSNKKISKVVEKFLKNPDKMTEEFGAIEFVDGDIQIETKTYSNSPILYRYGGFVDSSTTFYIEYKAKYGKKVALDLLFYKFIK